MMQDQWPGTPVDAAPAPASPRPQTPPPAARPQPRPAPQIRFADDVDALTRTVIGEAANQGPVGMRSVAAVALNRARQRNMTPQQIVLERNQFEPWGNAATAGRLMSIRPDDPRYVAARREVEAAMAGDDPTGGADHFYAPRAQAALGRRTPAWAEGREATVIGDHNFYRLGGSTEDARNAAPVPTSAMVQPGAAYGILKSEDLGPEDTPESLRAQGYEMDPARGVWARTVGSEEWPGQPADAAAPPIAPEDSEPIQTEGYRLAMADEVRKSELLGDQAGATFTDQFTAPINDELGFAAGYLGQGADNLMRRLTGREVEIGAIDRARAVRDVTKADQDAYQTENPVGALGGGLLGGFAFAPAKAAAIPGLLGRLGQAGGVGFGYGAAEGEGVVGRLGTGALGAGVSMATAGLLEAPAPLARTVMRGVERLRTPRADLPNRTERRVTGALGRSLERDSINPQTVLDNMANAPEGRLPLEAGGENLVGLAETLANAPGPARREIMGAVRQRRDGANNRVSAQLSESFGAQGNGFQALRQKVSARGEAANAGIEAIADAPVTLDDGAIQAFRSKLTTRAVRDATEEAIADLSPEGAAAANRLFGLGDEVLDNPGAATITVREAQDISYTLKEAASRAYRGGFNSRGEALQNLSNAIRTNARSPERGGVQAYDDWLKSFGDASESIEGQRVGQNIFARANEKNAMSAAELGDRWAKWSGQARENYRLGVGEAVLDRVRGNGGVAAMRRLLKDDEIAARVRIAFDSEDAFLRFMQTADDEVSMANIDNQLLGGSPTARRAAGQADLQEQSMGPMDAIEAVSDIGSPIAMGRRALSLLAKNLPRRDRSILGNEELNGLLGRALVDETAMTRLLNLLQTEGGIQGRVADRARALGLLSAPGVPASGQQRGRGLLIANP